MSYLVASLALTAMCLIGESRALAATIYTEIGDAGQTLTAAQKVNTLPGGTNLDGIRGNLEAGGADIFQIFLTGGKTFSATTAASSISFNNFDSQLFLFNSSGFGIYANDDDPNSPPQSTLPASVSLTPPTSGIYYLAISGSGYLPISAGGFIFPVVSGLLDQSTGGSTGAVGATGLGGSSILTNWSSVSGETGAYEILLTGAQFVPATTVPEPGSILLFGAGLCGAVWMRRRKLARSSC